MGCAPDLVKAVDGLVVPGLEREERAALLPDETVREGDARIETPGIADLEDPARTAKVGAQFLTFLDGAAQRLLENHMFSGGDRLVAQRHVELIRHGDNHGLNPGAVRISS